MLTYDRQKMGKLLREQRLLADFTQAEAATALGYSSPQFLSNVERGISVIPIKTLGKLIRLYRFDRDKVLDLLMAGSEEAIRRALIQKSTKARQR